MSTKNLTPIQIKSACYWNQAYYKGNWDRDKYKWKIDEKANQEYIAQLKRDKASDPKTPPDCSRWDRRQNQEIK